jgi:hypothetical protein
METKEQLRKLLYSGEFVGVENRPLKQRVDVLYCATKFYDKWTKKGYYVDSIGLLDGALQSWCVCKESNWEHAYETLTQHLNKNKVCYIRK